MRKSTKRLAAGFIKCLTLLPVLLIGISGMAQGFNFLQRNGTSNQNPAFYLYLPRETPDLTGPLLADGVKGDTGLLAFIELADGNFGFSQNAFILNKRGTFSSLWFSHNFALSQVTGQPLNGVSAVVKLTGIYGTPPRPHRLIPGPVLQAGSFPTAPAPDFNPVNKIAGSEGIKILSSIWDIAPDDAMVFVITYKLASGGSGKRIRFRYNRNAANDARSGAVIFKPLQVNDQEIVASFDGRMKESIARVRGYQSEKILVNPAEQSIDITDLRTDGLEHNIFITLVPESTLSKDETWVVADMLSIDRITPQVIYNSFMQLKTAPSHDPNAIQVLPKCIISNSVSDSLLKYKVTFRNMGRGIANRIRIVVWPGDHVIPNSFNRRTIGAKSGDRIYNPYIEPTPGQPNNRLTVNSEVAGDSLIFTISNAELKGPLSLNDVNSIRIQGELSFRLKRTQVPSGSRIVSRATIYFDDNPGIAVKHPAVVNFCLQPKNAKINRNNKQSGKKKKTNRPLQH